MPATGEVFHAQIDRRTSGRCSALNSLPQLSESLLSTLGGNASPSFVALPVGGREHSLGSPADPFDGCLNVNTVSSRVASNITAYAVVFIATWTSRFSVRALVGHEPEAAKAAIPHES